MTARRTNILITGGNFTNQGAYLMLCAAAEEIRATFQAQPVIAMQTGTERAKRWAGLDSLLAFPRFGIRVWGGNPEFLVGVRGRLPFIVGSEIDAVFDVSGFVFSDDWAGLDLRSRADDLLWWSRRGVPVVLLPQAFGPLHQTAEPVADLLEGCRAVFARDPDSESYLVGAGRDSACLERIRVATDFTALLTGEKVRDYEHLRGMVPIVPNWNIAERSESRGGTGDAYVQSLLGVVGALRKEGFGVYGLSHEGSGDADLLRTLANAVGDLEIVEGLNGRQSKWLLAQAPFVVSGRFHALVSALSQGIPVFIHGWSHKYKWLADEYGVSDFILDPYAGAEKSEELVLGRLPDTKFVREKLSLVASQKKDETREMWTSIKEMLDI